MGWDALDQEAQALRARVVELEREANAQDAVIESLYVDLNAERATVAALWEALEAALAIALSDEDDDVRLNQMYGVIVDALLAPQGEAGE